MGLTRVARLLAGMLVWTVLGVRPAHACTSVPYLRYVEVRYVEVRYVEVRYVEVLAGFVVWWGLLFFIRNPCDFFPPSRHYARTVPVGWRGTCSRHGG